MSEEKATLSILECDKSSSSSSFKKVRRDAFCDKKCEMDPLMPGEEIPDDLQIRLRVSNPHGKDNLLCYNIDTLVQWLQSSDTDPTNRMIYTHSQKKRIQRMYNRIHPDSPVVLRGGEHFKLSDLERGNAMGVNDGLESSEQLARRLFEEERQRGRNAEIPHVRHEEPRREVNHVNPRRQMEADILGLRPNALDVWHEQNQEHKGAVSEDAQMAWAIRESQKLGGKRPRSDSSHNKRDLRDLKDAVRESSMDLGPDSGRRKRYDVGDGRVMRVISEPLQGNVLLGNEKNNGKLGLRRKWIRVAELQHYRRL